jgi:hypothetical protein
MKKACKMFQFTPSITELLRWEELWDQKEVENFVVSVAYCNESLLTQSFSKSLMREAKHPQTIFNYYHLYSNMFTVM